MDNIEIRTIDGTGNNQNDLGAVGDELLRLQDNAFADGISEPRGGSFETSTLPNPRTISNIIADQIASVTNSLGVSDWLWQWGQFIDHDLDLNESTADEPGEFAPITVPAGDPNPELEGGMLPFVRVPAAEGTGEDGVPRETINQITAFIDGSSVYGSDEERAEFLRVDSTAADFGKGLLKTSLADNGEALLPLNDGTQENATGGTLGAFQFVAGDIRSNEQIGLTAVHTLLVREHNRLATEFHERLEAADEVLVAKSEAFDDEFAAELTAEYLAENPGATEAEIAAFIKDEFLYQTTRKVVAAEIQVITYNEFLPLLIGDDIGAYEGYDSTINPQVSTEFANAAYRLGHTLLSDQLLRVDAEGNTSTTTLSDAFFAPEDVQENGVDSLLQGLIFQEAQEFDNLVVDGVRDFLFPAGTGGLDLAAINIARGRDVGLLGYAAAYNEIFDANIDSFDDLGSGGLGLFADEVVALFEDAYETVDQIDLWIGGISELPDDHGGLLGPTFSFFVADQFRRSRDGDRFFYLEDDQYEHLTSLVPDLGEVTLAELIDLNIAEEFDVPERAFVADLANDFDSEKYPTIDADNNNVDNDFGEAGVQQLRILDNAYEDGISIPRGGPIDDSTLPNPRTISNIVADQIESVPNFLGISDWLWQWGQFLDHDFGLNEANDAFPPGEGDVVFIPGVDDLGDLPFIRVPAAAGTGTGDDNPRETINQITAFIDASSVYGSDEERATFLRSFEKGQLNTSTAANGEALLPLNRVGPDALENATGGTLGDFQYVAGDVRANEQLGLTAVHTLFVREHNYLTETIHERLEAGDEPELTAKYEEFAAEFLDQNPGATDDTVKDEFLYQAARKVVTAEIQVITYNEFLPLLIGNDLGVYEGYNSTIDVGVSTEFANAAYRLGHTLLSDQLLRVDAEGDTISATSLADAFFAPEDVQSNGIDTLLQGLIFQEAQAVDNLVVDGVRDFLFPAGTGGLDLAAINIARGRDVGLPGYAAAYNDIFGTDDDPTPITSFGDLGSDGLGLFADEVVALFEEAYETVDQIDLWIAGVSELPDDHGGLLGPTFSFFIADQFGRARDGDRFFYLEDDQAEHLEVLAPELADTTLSEVIDRNVAEEFDIPENAFVAHLGNDFESDKYAAIDADNNNLENDFGETGSEQLRLLENAYEDGISTPRGGPIDDSTLPNPRTISNIVSDQIESVTNFLGISDWIWQWGQFLDHDFGLNEANGEFPPGEGDVVSIPGVDDLGDLPFVRVPAAEGTGTDADNPRETINQITAFIDASSVYGSDEERASFLRSFEKGQLRTSTADNGEILLPLNRVGPNALENATGGTLGDFQYVAGDVRANEQIGLTAVHTLLVREHNRLTEELHERLEAGDEPELTAKYEEFVAEFSAQNPVATDDDAKDEFLYQAARKVVTAEIQAITYTEFLPLLIGNDLGAYEGYDSSIDVGVSTEFANAAYRLGHTLLSDQLLRVDAEGNTISSTSLADAFFDPEDVQANGVDTLLQGLIFQESQEVDNLIVDGVRDFLFPAGTGGLDLAAINIARGRDVGLPGYAAAHNEIFGTSIDGFDDLGSSGLGLFADEVVALFEQAYESVDQIDLWIGGVSELPDDHGGLLGPTFSFFVADQFGRARDGDRFFYLEEEQAEHLSILAPDLAAESTLAELIDRNIAEEFEVPEQAFAANLLQEFESDKYPAIDATGNNRDDLGAAGGQLLRILDNAYEDGISVPRGGPLDASTLPNPRTISNIVSDQTDSVTNFLGASDWLWQWGQFLDHDFGLNEANAEFPAGDGDVVPIPGVDDLGDLPFVRVPAAEGTGTSTSNPRETINQITSFIDASSVYGSDEERATFLRAFSKGQLETSVAANGEALLPLNRVGTDALENATGGTLGDLQYVAGDVRANEQLGLTAVHTLFVREHNRLTEDLHTRLEAGDEPELTAKFEEFSTEFQAQNPTATDEQIKDEFLYQAARKVVTAEIQLITYDEFVPILVGNDLGIYSGYDSNINPQVSTEFANAAYRLGHTLLSDQLLRVDAEGNTISATSLVDAFFDPADIQANGIDTLLQGLIFQQAQAVDNLVVDGVRDFLFPAGTGGLDLAAINIQRGRETGLPGYAAAYNDIFGTAADPTPISDFSDLGSSGLGLFDDSVVALFEQAYTSVDQIDLWIGGISELPDDHGGLLGPTFSFFVADQFGRARDGDRFFYLDEEQAEHLSILAPDLADTTLSNVIDRNIAEEFEVPENAFFVQDAGPGEVLPFMNNPDVDGVVDGGGFNTIPSGPRADVTGVLDDAALGETDALFDNLVGFYQVTDTSGGIDTDGDGIADLNPGDAGYARAAIVNRVSDFQIRAGSSGDPDLNTGTDIVLGGGQLYAPFVIANGGGLGFDGFVAAEDASDVFNDAATAIDDAVAYFSFVGANPDGARHLQARGNNVFGFEDLPSNLGVSDNDFNDVVFSFSFG